ncbi:MAG TPA: nitrite reductase large subunit NirB, partial [Pseudonocardiaceae bacterium]|nr:nitrite reductase large subunit NirB [Pseudonocardiaceae bacterium]
MQELVVIGNGMAGARAVEEILARGGSERFRISMFGEEPHGNYNRILLSELLARGADPEGHPLDDDLFLNPRQWYQDNGVMLHAGVRVVRLDRFGHRVYADDGSVLRYDKLVLATGSRPFFPPMDGLWVDNTTLTPGVFGFRTLHDTTTMMRYARGKQRAAVIGGGLLGLEAARGLQAHGLAVHIVHAAQGLMNQQLDAQAGLVLRRSLERLGMTVHTGVRTTAIRRGHHGAVIGVTFADATTLDVDMVVVAAGIRPNIGLAMVSGLETQRGIVVDDQLRSMDDDDIYAVGECVQHRGQVYGLVGPLWEQAAVLADHITGTNPAAAYHGSRMATKLKVAGVDVATMGLKEPQRPDDEFVQFSEPCRGVYQTVIIRDGVLVGATLLGDVSKVASLTQAFDRRAPLPAERIKLLFDIGAPPPDVGAVELADDAQVCDCNGVSKGRLIACVRDGQRTVNGVMTATRAGKGCGGCQDLVADIVTAALGADLEADPAENYYVPCIPLDKPQLVTEIRRRGLRSTSAVFAALAEDGAEHAGSKMALSSLLKMMWNEQYIDERDGRFINDRVHANIQRDGTFSVVPQVLGGVTTPAQLRRIAEVAERYQIPLLKITGGQRIDLLGVRKEDLPKVWADLDMPSGYAYGKSFRTVKTCVGRDFCRFGLGDSTQLGIDIERRYQGLESPAKMKLAVSGCPRNCAESYVKDVGIVAIEGGRWEIYVGGAAGAHVRKGDLLATVQRREEAITLTGRFLQYY